MVEKIIIDKEYYSTGRSSFKQVFKELEFGLYQGTLTLGTRSIKQVCEIESPL